MDSRPSSGMARTTVSSRFEPTYLPSLGKASLLQDPRGGPIRPTTSPTRRVTQRDQEHRMGQSQGHSAGQLSIGGASRGVQPAASHNIDLSAVASTTPHEGLDGDSWAQTGRTPWGPGTGRVVPSIFTPSHQNAADPGLTQSNPYDPTITGPSNTR